VCGWHSTGHHRSTRGRSLVLGSLSLAAMFSWTAKRSALFPRSLARGVPISELGRDACVAALPSHRAVVFGAMETNYPIFPAI
jgi:hypothetical protein